MMFRIDGCLSDGRGIGRVILLAFYNELNIERRRRCGGFTYFGTAFDS
jgi:hypothetical protein